MTEVNSQFYQGDAQLTDTESKIAASLAAAEEELARTECFDDEQRAEIYAILGAIRSDSENHQKMVKTVTDKIAKGVSDA